MTIQTRRQPRVKVCNNSHLNLTIMSKLQGISGGLSGKTGSYTFRQSRGQTIVSQYQPVVKNPNTQGQQNQRAKFKLMSQLAAIMSPGFKRPGKQEPTQRNAFVQLNMPLVEVTSDNQEVVAKIPMEQLKLTSSFRNISPITADAVQGGIDMELENLSSDISTVRVILVGYNKIGGAAQAVVMSITDVPATNGTASYSFEGLANGKYTILAYGLIPSESAASTIDLGNIHTPSDEDFISAVELNTMVANGEMAETMTVGTNVTVGS